jgi:hypothetical protein
MEQMSSEQGEEILLDLVVRSNADSNDGGQYQSFYESLCLLGRCEYSSIGTYLLTNLREIMAVYKDIVAGKVVYDVPRIATIERKFIIVPSLEVRSNMPCRSIGVVNSNLRLRVEGT